MKEKEKKKKSNRIRGNTRPFENTLMAERYTVLMEGFMPEDLLIEFRNLAKDAFALRMQDAARRCNKYTMISDSCRNIIITYLMNLSNHPFAYRFVACFIDSYNNNIQHLLRINEPKCKTCEKKNALKHGMMDCLKSIKTYVKPIFKQMEKNKDEINLNLDPDLIGKYKDIGGAVIFICRYLHDTICGVLPLHLSIDVFNNAATFDAKIKKCYVYNSKNKRYDRVKKYFYSGLQPECATYIFCYRYH